MRSLSRIDDESVIVTEGPLGAPQSSFEIEPVPAVTQKSDSATILMRLPQLSGLRVSPATFRKLCAANRDLRLTRTPRGTLIVMPPAGSDSGSRNATITAQLWAWNQASKLGICFDSSSGFTFPDGMVHAPDASWIKRERWEKLDSAQKRRFAPISPDFVIELCSPSDNRNLIRRLMRQYMDQGVQLAWMLDPDAALVEIYRAGQPVESLTKPAALSGEGVLPGFVLDLRGVLFE